MKFPGKRKRKHYFPVSERGRTPLQFELEKAGRPYIVGIDQPLVDIETHVEEEFLEEWDIPKGQSVILSNDKAEKIYDYLDSSKLISGEFAGGAIGNTLHNYCTLAECETVLLGTIKKKITVGDYAYKYLCHTNSLVDLSLLTPVNGHMGRAFCFITPDGERTFGIAKGQMNDLPESAVRESLIQKSSGLLVSAFLLREEGAPIKAATLKAVNLAKKHDIPVIFSLGTEILARQMRDELQSFIQEYVNVLAMNEKEAMALMDTTDPLEAGKATLKLADMSLLTLGAEGLCIFGHVDEKAARKTRNEVFSVGSLSNYNEYEFSRGMLKRDCEKPLQIMSHIDPFMGGPELIKNTNGAGDAALAALLHDLTANNYHRQLVPNSPKHKTRFLTYSSLSQVSKYCNRVSFEVLRQNSPRLIRGLPEKEDCLEEAYWER